MRRVGLRTKPILSFSTEYPEDHRSRVCNCGPHVVLERREAHTPVIHRLRPLWRRHVGWAAWDRGGASGGGACGLGTADAHGGRSTSLMGVALRAANA
jgi:hypothetical protein